MLNGSVFNASMTKPSLFFTALPGTFSFLIDCDNLKHRLYFIDECGHRLHSSYFSPALEADKAELLCSFTGSKITKMLGTVTV